MLSRITSPRAILRALCFSSLLVLGGTAHAVAPAAPTNFAMPKYTFKDGSTEIWRLQWTDNSTDEDGFLIYYSNPGIPGSTPNPLGTVPTSWSITGVTTTSGSTTVTCNSTANLAANWTISGPNIPAGTKVASVTNATTFVLSAAATGSGTGQTLSAGSIYKAGSGYTYALDIQLPTGWGGYAMAFSVAAYKGTTSPEYSSNTNLVVLNPFPGAAGLTLTTPSGLTVTPSGDGQFHIAYNDNSNSEAYFELDYKLHTDSTWLGVGLDYGVSAGSTTGAMSTDVGGYKSGQTVYLPNYLPGTEYDFKIRAVDFNSNPSAFTSTVTATTQAFKAPSTLATTVLGEDTFNLSFTNNSTAASGYNIQYRLQGGSGTWVDFANVEGNYYNIIGPIQLNPQSTYEFQLRAFIRGANNTTTAPILYSTFTNTATVTLTMQAPSGLTATTVSNSAVNLSWVDNSSIEGGIGIYARLSGSANYTLLDYAAQNATTYAVSGLSPGLAYDFVVTSVYGTTTTNIDSAPSNTATATTKDGFTSLTYAPITYQQAFSYQAVVSTASVRSSWNITGLPAGLSFNSSTGIVSGTPTVTGVFTCPMTATFANGWTTNSSLTLRVVRAAAAPVAATTIAGQMLASGANASISMTDKFADPDSESAVRVVTNIGTMDFILYNTATPQTVTNFLSYVNNPSSTGNYTNAVFHRSVPGFIVQGGGFKVASDPDNFTAITTTASPPNEPGISNLRGTVAMAKVGSDPNSATDQFFVNLADNSANLDLQNGGFTAFARVAGNGMAVADAMAALPRLTTNTVNVDGNPTTSLTDWPLTSASASMDTSLVVSITSINPVPVLSYSITGNTNAAAVGATLSGTDLQISGTAGGQSDVTVTATDLDGSTVSQTFTVTVSQSATITSSAPPDAAVGADYSFTYSSPGFPVPTYSVTTGALPDGLTLSSAGVISGTPTVVGSFSGVVTATNTSGSDTQSFSITVAKGTAPIALVGLSQTYDGTPRAVTATTTPPGLTVDITYGDPASSTPPSDFGSYAVSATINDTNYSGTQTGILTITGQSAASWRTEHFTTEQINAGLAADNADPDGDGFTNFEEYALGVDPLARTPALAPTVDANGLTLTFTRPKALPGVTYAAESTDNLTSWNSLTLEVITDGPVQTIRVRDPLATGNPNRRFIHLIFGTTP